MAIPTVTPFIVNHLHLSDQVIGLSQGLFNVTVFLGSLSLNNAANRFGNKTVTGLGVMGLSMFPILTSLGTAGFIVANLVGGLAWSMAGGAIYNYILENVPADDRPAHIAWYSLVSNAAILIGSLVGPAIALSIGPALALVLFGIGRFLAGAAILKWG
jgi:MFS family permease